MPGVFTPLPRVPDHPALERDVLARWEAEGTFEQLRAQNRGGERFSFIDGPITANNPMGAHHAWGRTLKDVFQRYKALRGFDQRYQNGFDCQGLWVEVEVEKALGLNSKREIEEYGLAEFAERCKERVAHYAEVITDQDRRLGRWMDWDADYYTFSDTNIEYIWRFLKVVHERGWLYQGHRSTQWCPRCGTSISQHEVYSGEYQELDHPSLYVRFPLADAEGESLVIWTTTPWTLPANVAAAVRPDAEYGRTAEGEWYAVERRPDADFVERVPGEELVGRPYRGPFDDLAGGGGGRASRHPVGRRLARRGHGHRPHRPGRGHGGLRAGPRARPAGARADRRVRRLLRQLRRAGGHRGRCGGGARGRDPPRARSPRRGREDRPPLSHVLALQDAAPLPRRRRLVHLRRGDPAADARRERDGRVDAVLLLEADGRLAAEHGRLEHLAQAVLRPAAADLPVRVRPRDGGRVARRARAARRPRARRPARAAPAVDRRRRHHLRQVRGGGHAHPRGRRRLARRRASSRSRRSAGTTRREPSRAGTARAPRRG